LIEDHADVAHWRARAEVAEARVAALETANAELRAANAELSVRVAELSEQVAVLSRMLFGDSSEKKGTGRPGGGAVPDSADGEGDRDQPRGKGQRRGSAGHGRRDYAHLETREEIHDVPAGQRCCRGCGAAFEFLDYEAAEQIDWQVRITRIVHRRRRYRRRCDCPGQPRTVIAPVPGRPIAKGRFTPAFLARLLFEKYVLGRPLHRIARALSADGFDVAEGTLSGALKAVAALLVPLEAAIAARNAAASHVHCDETSWRVFERVEGKDGHRWWLWVAVAEDTCVFIMDPTRSAAVLEAHLGIDRAAGSLEAGRRLLVSSDFYSVYQSIGRVEGVDPLWCWAHIRRYFIRAGDAHLQLRFWRDQWVERIAALYVAHRDLAVAEVATAGHTAARQAFEQALAEMDLARTEQSKIYSLHPAARKVLDTLAREWDGLVRHRDFPDLDLDNNRAERALRTPVVGRKNYYGSQAEWAAHLAARVWTITATAERNDREPLAYLTGYLTACADAGGAPPDDATLETFLPWRKAPGDTAGSRDDDPPDLFPPDQNDPLGPAP
jgi:transposase